MAGKRIAACVLAALAFYFVALAPAAARLRAAGDDRFERIAHFASDITVETNGSVRVRETITVNARGYDIKRGIYRDFPTLYRDGMHVGFEVLRVLRDGHEEPYAIENLQNGKRVRIGSADVFLDPGFYTYTIEYTTDRQLAFLAGYDELYWNVTGNAWQFRIDDAEATVHLPPSAHITQYASYTGPQGAKGVPARTEVSGNTIHFRTVQALNSNEGLTIGVGFSKGAVAPPGAGERLAYFVRDHGPLAAFIVGLAILLAYFCTVWVIGGRDPKGGTLIPLFEPPEDLSPASLRYVERMGYDGKMFSSVLVSMAVKGFLTITQDGKTYTLKRTGPKAKEAGLAPDEAEAARELFAHGDNTVELVQKNHTVVSKAIGALSRWLSLHFGDGYVRGNWSLFWPGLIIALAVAIAIFVYSDDSFGAFLVTLWSSLALMGTLAFGLGAGALWVDVFRGGGGGSLILAILLLLPTAAFAGMTVGALFFVYETVPPYVPVLVWVLVPVLVIFRRLLRAPTADGAKLLTAIKGFRLFLTTAEEDRLRALNPPEVTPKLFERFLPYAIALDCEIEWGRKFEAAAARAGMTPVEAQSFQPTWYSGQTFTDIGSGNFTQSVAAALATATASASVSPSSSSYSSSSSSSSFSSGSSGGGSSGGGGGGGGGGGW